MKALGKHILLDLYDCEHLDDLQKLRDTMLSVAKLAGATVIQDFFHHFSPYGISGVIVIAESHLTIHTWPEHRYVAIDFFTCADSVNTDLMIDLIKRELKSQQIHIKQFERGSNLIPNSKGVF